MSEYIPFVMSFDRNYSDYAAVTVLSILQNTKNKSKFYWLIPKKDFLLVDNLKKSLTLDNSIKIITVEKNDFEILSVLRNLKIIGIFTRLSIRDNKHNYLKLIPYTWKLIEDRIDNNDVFIDLKKKLEDNFPKKIRKKNES